MRTWCTWQTKHNLFIGMRPLISDFCFVCLFVCFCWLLLIMEWCFLVKSGDCPLCPTVQQHLSTVCGSPVPFCEFSSGLPSLSLSTKALYHYLLVLLLHTTLFLFFFTVSDFVDGSDLYTLWRQEKRLDDTTVKLYSAELAVTLG